MPSVRFSYGKKITFFPQRQNQTEDEIRVAVGTRRSAYEHYWEMDLFFDASSAILSALLTAVSISGKELVHGY